MHRFNVASLGKSSPLYSHAAKSGGLLSIAGMLGEGDGFEEQCEGAYGRVLQVLQHEGLGWQHVLQFTTYLTRVEDIPLFNAWRIARYAEMFPSGNCPPNTMLVVSALAGEGRRIELQALAVEDAAGTLGSRYAPDVVNSPPGQES
jgi:enamine deaminase RidA (YjgF/YER057c/UK114 family)